MLLALYRRADAFAREHTAESRGHVQIQGVAELIRLGTAVDLHARGLVPRVMPAEVGPAQGPEQFAQSFVPQEVHALVRDLEARVAFAAHLALPALRLLRIDVVLLLHLLDDLVDELFHLLGGEILELLLRLFVEHLSRFQRLPNGLAQILHRLVVEFAELRVGVVEAGIEQEVRQRLQQVFQSDAARQIARELRVSDALQLGQASLVQFRRMGTGADSGLNYTAAVRIVAIVSVRSAAQARY